MTIKSQSREREKLMFAKLPNRRRVFLISSRFALYSILSQVASNIHWKSLPVILVSIAFLFELLLLKTP
jgi:hypothetical protein